ncbi:MAG: triose-phosphate isomerase [Novosphingobium sp.]|nr:triose-phosphate isomerase [Novosphingobium sp.]
MSNLPYIVGNWKMNGLRAMLTEARAIDRSAARYPKAQVALAPPTTLIFRLRDACAVIGVGGQDCHSEESGAYTGDVSAAMLKDAGSDFTIVGHSERRAIHGETDSTVKAKAEAALAAGLGVIVCVGETEDERDAGKALKIVSKQLDGSLPKGEGVAERLTVAYEPVWAIGTGRVPSIEDIAAMHQSIRKTLDKIYTDAGSDIRILYGGSVKADNASEILAVSEVGGALVGGASLSAESFLAIVGAACAEIDD